MQNEQNKKWEYKNSPLSKGVFYYVNEDLDEDIEEIGDVIKDVANKLGNKTKETPTKQNSHISIVKKFNSIFLYFYNQLLTEKQALKAVQRLIIQNPKYKQEIKVINLGELPKLQGFINLKDQAIENKEFEKAAEYCDLTMDYDRYIQYSVKELDSKMDAYFAYWVDVLYFVIKEEDTFNQEVLNVLSEF